MAIGANAVWWVQTTAPAGNISGGGFDTAATFDTTLAATSATGTAPVASSVNYTFVPGDAGYYMYIASGSNWTPGWYLIASVSGGAATLTATIGTALQFDTTIGSPATKYQLNTVAGCATTASPTAGSWAIDYSRSDTAKVAAVADLTIDGSVNTKVTSASRTFGKNDIGNMVHVISGTGWTAGYYEIASVAAGAATLDRSPSAAANANKGTYAYGAATSLGSATTGRTDTVFAAAPSAGNRVFIKAGTYSAAASMSFGAGTTTSCIILEGYNTTPGDSPVGSNRPVIAMAAQILTMGASNQIYNVSLTGTGTSVIVGGTGSVGVNVKVVNSSSTSGRNAFSWSVANAALFYCEAVCYRGFAILRGTGGGVVDSCYMHDSDVGLRNAGGNVPDMYIGNLIEDNVTAAISFQTGITSFCIIKGNTLYGSENKLGIGISIPTAQINSRITNNIIAGFVTGISAVDTSNGGFGDYNDFYNNTTDVTPTAAIRKGMHELALNPTFTSVTQITGTTGKFTAANDRLVDTSKNFSTLGVVAGQDKLNIISGTGTTAGFYGVSSLATTTNPNDTLVLDVAPGTDITADKTYQLTVGHNFSIGTNLKAQGFPGLFPGGLTTSYPDMGAIQRQESGAGGSFTFA